MEDEVETVHPPLFRRHARRPRLTRLLDKNAAQAILFIAPAGYGKTTLAQEWLQGRDRVVWYRAANASADVAAFSAGLSDVIAALVPGAGERLKQRLRVADTPERAARPLAELLAEDMAAWPEDGLLVIDDYHLVADSAPVEDFFDWLLTLAPHLRVLVTSRRRPRWASVRRILYGEIVEIGRDQLAMTAEEAGRVLEDRSTGSVRALVAHAEGWPAIIGLAALTASEDLPTERVSDALYRYFAEEVVRRESPEVERFMLLASVPNTVDAGIAREVLGVEEPDELLNRLSEEGLLQPTGEDYRFHPLLRSFLRRRLESEEFELFQELVDHAVLRAQRLGRWEEAFEIAAASRRTYVAIAILEKAGQRLLAEGRQETLERWLDECRALGDEGPAAGLLRAEIALRNGELSKAAARAEALATRMGSQDELASRAWFLAGQALYLSSQSEAARDFQRRAKALAKNEDDMKRALWGLAMTESELGIEDAEEHIDVLERLAADDINAKLRVGLGRQIAAANRGSFKGIWKIIAPLTALAEHATDPMAQTTLWANAAYLCIARADYAQGAALSMRALEACERFRLNFARGYCFGYLAEAAIGQRRFQSATTRLQELAAVAEAQDNSYMRATHAVGSIRLALAKGNPTQALRVLPSLDDSRLPLASRGELLSLLAVAHAAHGDSETALAHAEEALAITKAVETMIFGAATELIVSAQSGNSNGLRAHLEAFIYTAEDADFLDAVVVTYRACPSLLDLYGEQTPPPVLRKLLAQARDGQIAKQFAIDIGLQDSWVTDLTKREMEVLALLSEGLTNAEIGRRLFITQSTVKVHVRHILEKLGVRTRLQAVLAAQDLLARL
jgi:LuxR family transcriptional regulator, maltose regulon positive regulatory protein